MTAEREARAWRLFASLSRQGVRFRSTAGGLAVSAPNGVMTAEIGAAIRDLKPELATLIGGAFGDIPITDRSKPSPLGVVQERMWAHEQLEPESLIHNLPAAWKFDGPFDAAAAIGAFDDFVERHEAMQLHILVRDGIAAQRARPALTQRLVFVDFVELGPSRAMERALVDIEGLRLARFDRQEGPLWLSRLYRLADQEHVLYLMPHHLIWDGWCFDLFLRDFAEFYRARLEARAPRLPSLKAQYPDYAVWHRSQTEHGRWTADIDHWRDRLSAPPEAPALPADKPRGRLFSHVGDWIEFKIGAALTASAATIAAAHRGTRFMVFLAAWRAFLARLSGETDILIAAPVQARQHPATGDMIGCFVNNILLRHKIGFEQSLHSIVEETRDICLDAYEHQEAPFEILVDELAPDRDPSRTPLSQVMFSHQEVSGRPTALGAATISQIHVNPRTTPTELLLAIMELDDGARGVLHYAFSLYTREQAAMIASSFETFLADAMARPSAPIAALETRPPSDRTSIDARSAAAAPRRDEAASALDLFLQQATATPEKIAVRAGKNALTYAGLAARSADIAAALDARGVGAGDIVGLMLDRSTDMIASMLAIWRVGAAYLPLDPNYPEARLKFMIEDSKARVVLSSGSHDHSISPETLRLEEVSTLSLANDRPQSYADRAYVIYTSGSTGAPKAVENSHGALVNFLGSMARTPGFRADDRILAITTLSFDISILELILPLTVGGDVVIAAEAETKDPALLTRLIADVEPTVMQATPAGWLLLLDQGWTGSRHLKALCGGEALTAALAESLLPRVGELWNMYGPTETTVWSTCGRIADPADISVGGPIENTLLEIVDAADGATPTGAFGELLIGGAGVAIGYLGRDALTAERFVFRDGVRFYRTGDVARRRHDGKYEIIGRRDGQVKLRGFRIELGEIEAALERHEAVRRAIAAIKADASGEPALAAYVQYRDEWTATGSELRRYLRSSLPAHMIPQYFAEMDTPPLSPSGKVDRRLLPELAGGSRSRSERVEARTETEKTLAEIWRDLLKVDDISVTDNFFELGGQSLQAAQMAARFTGRTGLRFDARAAIFETLEQLVAGARTAS